MSEQIDCGDGWRLLRPEEVVRDGDEFINFGEWQPVFKLMIGEESSGAVRRRVPSKPKGLEVTTWFKVEVGSNADFFAILQAGPPDEAGDVVIGDTAAARQLADWLNRFADWREAQNL